jgi:hypothetical protein
MNFFTTRNTVLLALVQIIVIVFSVLMAGACLKWYSTFISMEIPITSPWATSVFAEYGFLALLLPVIWVVIALRTLQRDEEAQVPRLLVFLSGIILLLVLLIGAWYAAARPFFDLLLRFN